MRKFGLTVAITLATVSCLASVPTDTIDLSGLWRFQLDPMGFGKTPGSEMYLSKLTETIQLPGTTDEGGKGIKNTAQYVDRLSRKYEYNGPAWYQREIEIPAEWASRRIVLELERCHWETTVYVDGEEIGTDERLSTPNRFVLENLTPGLHTLTISIDNRLKYPMDQWAHGTTEYTQTNWNGMIGKMLLTSHPSTTITDMQIYPDVDSSSVRLYLGLVGEGEGDLEIKVADPDGQTVAVRDCRFNLPADSAGIKIEIPLGKNVKLWDEFNPDLYSLTATIKGQNGESESINRNFGMRKVEQGKHHLSINGVDRHLRGVLDCCVFPLTGYPPTEPEEWEKVMSTIKEYGFNHIRFHSWCPPEAAFEVADKLGLYLQVELPMWIKDVGQYPARRQFFEDEMYAILDEYGNHPSFVLYCNGNENEGDFSVLEDLIIKGRKHDPRHLFSASTARAHVSADQFYTSHVSPNGWITVYEGRPSTDWDLTRESAIDVPVIAHETGQRCMYPNFKEMSKYTGILEPRNMNLFKERLAKNGMAHQADDFFKATGSHTVLQYKDVNEALLRTPTSGGYQLLGLQDFPGQGSAFVGVLDAFWESKGLVTPEKYRESNGPVVPLARFPKRIYTNSEQFPVKLEVYNYGENDIRKGKLNWSVTDHKGTIMKSGHLRHNGASRSSVDSLGQVEVSLQDLPSPASYSFNVDLNGYHNEWKIWVYPDDETASTGISFITSWEEARRLLAKGESVLLIPDSIEGRKTHFASHFWNPIMFNWDPMIVGTLIHNTNGAFKSFPTDIYADWQWTDILNNSRAIDLTDINGITPVIQSVDTYEVNRKLGIAFEAATPEGGRLFVLCIDPKNNIESRPASLRLIKSVAEYVGSSGFRPETIVPLYQLDAIFDHGNKSLGINKSSEAIKQLLNQ